MANRQDPPSAWDPLKTNNYDLPTIGEGLFGSAHLVKVCRENIYTICPGLAESWENNSDFTQWTFKVRNSILWHDGTPFTVDDAKYWLDLVSFGVQGGGKTRLPAFFKAEFGEVRKVEVLEGNRVRITLASPAPQYLFSITNPQRNIAHPRHLVQPRFEKGEVDVAPQDIGWVATGPFKMLKYEKGSRAQVRRFDKYWEKDGQGRQLPYLDGMDFAIIRDPTAMDAAFRTGYLDGGARGAGHYLTPERERGYVRDLGDKVWFARIGASRTGIAFNTLKAGPLQDVRVRKAISLWMDKQAATDGLYGGSGYLFTLLAPENPFTSPDFKTWPGWNKATREQDRAEAKRLMAQAGYAGGFPMNIICVRRWTNLCEFTHAQLAGLGIALDIALVDEAGWNAGRLVLDYHSQIGGTANETTPEATEVQLTVFSKSNFAPAKHEDPKVLDAFRRLNATTALEERARVWRELERYYLLEQVYTVSLFGELAVIPYRSGVKGLPVTPEGVMFNLDFATVWLDQ
jgi:peptide/nickel transport system substrate-binding protein